jgi:hypothetical protein
MKFHSTNPASEHQRSAPLVQTFRSESAGLDTAEHVDGRDTQAAQRKLNSMADASPPVVRQMALNARADGSARVVAQAKLRDAMGIAQRVEEDELAKVGQKKSATAQLIDEEEKLGVGQKKSATAQLVDEEEKLGVGQMKPATAQLAGEELEEPAGGAAQMKRGSDVVQHKRESPVQREQENRTGLPDQLKSGVENLSGMSMDHVKVHYNSPQPAQLNALAYAQGSEIHVAPGQEKHVPHEAWHVVQQAQGRVQPTTQMKEGTPVNNDPNLEHEADVMGAKAMQMRIGPAPHKSNH